MKEKIPRVPTGIKGLDEMLGGGLLKKRHVLVTGGPGSGKTTFAMQFLYNGAEKFGDKGLFISLEEKSEKLVENLSQGFNWDLEKHLREGNIVITTVDKFDWDTLTDMLQSYVTRHKVRRVVIDPLTILRLNTRDTFEFRRKLIGLLGFLENLDCTVLLTSESQSLTREASTYTLEEFVVDGVIVLYNIPVRNERRRALEIVKMRGVAHSNNIYPFKITPNGIVVYQEEII